MFHNYLGHAKEGFRGHPIRIMFGAGAATPFRPVLF